MKEDTKQLRDKALYYKGLLLSGAIDITEAKKYILPYIEAYNSKAIELAKKYNVKAKKLTFASFTR
jgi:hypothetical protein